MMNYAWDFSQSETEKYFDGIIIVLGRHHVSRDQASWKEKKVPTNVVIALPPTEVRHKLV